MKKTCGVRFIHRRGTDPVLEQLRKEHGLFSIHCDLEPGHEGNHRARTKIAVYEWWNSEKNPQKGIKP